MRVTSVCLATGLLLSPVAASADYTMEQQNACMGDAFRLCSEFIPNQDAVAHCMRVKHRDLSRQCRVVFDSYRPNSHPSRSYGSNAYPNSGYSKPSDSHGGAFGYWPQGGYQRPMY